MSSTAINPAHRRPSPLQLWLGVLAGLASLAALQATLLPPWPKARPLSAAAISEALRNGNMGLMDYYRMQNVMADTSMRASLGKPEQQG